MSSRSRSLPKKWTCTSFLASSKRGIAKDLQAEIDAAQKEASALRQELTDLVEKVKVFELRNEDPVIVANNYTSHVQQKIDQIGELQKEMAEIQVMADGLKSKIHEIAQAKMSLVDVQLWVAKEKDDTRAQQNEDFRTQLSSVIAERDALGKELETTRSRLEITLTDDDEMVAQYKVDVEAFEARLRTTTEYVR